jgi:hypothetical protein
MSPAGAVHASLTEISWHVIVVVFVAVLTVNALAAAAFVVSFFIAVFIALNIVTNVQGVTAVDIMNAVMALVAWNACVAD